MKRIDSKLSGWVQKGLIAVFGIALFSTASITSGQTQITISPETRHQTMVGFGGALTWYSNRIFNGDQTTQNEILDYLFVDSGIDVVRLKNWYHPTGYPTETDPTTGAWGDRTSHGTTSQIYAAAKAANPDIQVLLSSWGPPAFLKSNDSRTDGGTLKKDVNGDYMYAELAQYFVDMLDNQDWSPDYLSFQNEPGWVASWDSCEFDATETASKAGYVEAADAIWNAIKDRPTAPKMLGSEAENRNAFLNMNPAVQTRDYFSVHGYHIYDISVSQIDSSKSKFNQIRDNFSDLPNWMTEFSKNTYDWIDAGRIIHSTVVEANASAYIYWTLGWGPPPTDTNGIPTEATHSMIELANDGSYTINPHYYTIKHYAKYVNKGYQRIDIGGSTDNVRVSGYLSTNQTSITLVAVNKTASTETIALSNSTFSVSGIAGYQSVVSNYWQTMTGLDAATPIDLPAESITTIVLTLAEAFNVAPVANNNSVTTEFNTTLPVTLSATDADNNDLTYSIVSTPTNGSLSGTATNLTYTPTNNYQGADSFTFKVNDGKVDSNIATVSITVNPPNSPPVADDQAVNVFYNTPEGVTLTGSDTEGDPLTYSIVSNPTNGSLSGTVPNLTYTPNTNYSGSDSFSFTINDTYNDSNTGTVSITVSSSSNTVPEVSAGTDASAYLSGSETVNPTAGAEIFLDAAQDPDGGVNDIWEDTLSTWDLTLDTANGVTYDSNPGSLLSGITAAYDFPGGESGAGGASTSAHFKSMGWQTTPVTIEIWFKPDSTADDGKVNGQVLFETGGSNGLGLFYNDGFLEVGSDTTEVISVDVTSMTDEFIQAVLTYDAGNTHNFILYLNGVEAATGNRADDEWSGANGSGLGARSDSNTGGRGDGDAGTESFEGKIAMFRAYQNQVLTGSEVLANYQSIDGSSAVHTLNGSASDVDGQELTTAWTLVSGPGAVIFADASAVNTTVSFALAGDYVLRLTADDGYGQTFDDVTITVNAGGYTVVYDDNDADSGVAPVDSNSPYTADATVTVLGNTGMLARTDFAFTGWNTMAAGTGTDYVADDTFTVTNNVMLYAVWARTSSSVTVTGSTSYTYNGVEQGPDTAIVAGSTGAVSYSYSGIYDTSYGPSGTKPLAVGSYQVVATVAADANYNGATSDPLAFLITSEQDLLTNGDFELGYNNGWTHLTGDGVATFSDETASPYEGSHALKAVISTLGSNPWSIQSLGATLSLTVGEDYTLTFWGKAATAGTSIKMVMQGTNYVADVHNAGTDWLPYTWTFTAQETAPQLKVQFPEVGTLWIDDIQLAPVHSSTNPPTITDVDNDGMPDDWETGHGLSVSTNNASLDSDFDGATDYEEFIAGTDPMDPTKRLKILSVTVNASGERTITWNSEQDGTTTARRYMLQRSTSLISPDWANVSSNISSSGSTTGETDSESVPAGLFYRILPY